MDHDRSWIIMDCLWKAMSACKSVAKSINKTYTLVILSETHCMGIEILRSVENNLFVPTTTPLKLQQSTLT